MTLTEEQVKQVIELLAFVNILKWGAALIPPLIFFLLRQLGLAIKHLASIASSLQKILVQIEILENKVESLERDLGFTQVKIARSKADE